MAEFPNEESLLRSVALQNAQSILVARHRAEEELAQAKEALQLKSQELAHSLALVQATLESTADGILATDDNGVVTGFNENFGRMWRIPREILESGSHRQILEATSKYLREPAQFVAKTNEVYASSPLESHDLLELVDGRVLERYSRIQYVDGKNVGRVWGFRDVTDRRRADETRARLAAIVEASDDAIVSKTLEGIILSWNAGAERLFGYTADEAVGQSIQLIIPPELRAEEYTILERLRRGEKIAHYETVRISKQGRRLSISLMVSPVRDSAGRIIGASKIARDITDRKLADLERASLLESERAARVEAERAGRLKDEFLATLSHELRTPLNAILGWSRLIDKNPDPKMVNEGIQVITRNAQVQADLISDLLDMSRIISGKIRLQMQEVDPSTVVQAAVDSVRPVAEAKQIRIVAAINATTNPVRGDPSRLQQVVWNLLTNAIKFTPPGGIVEVALAQKDTGAEIKISDTGKGIGPDFLPFVFDRFRQADSSTTREHSGLGLGLAIVKQLVELHGGRVGAESGGEGKGSTFTVELPLADRATAEQTVRSGHLYDASLPGEIRLDGVQVLAVDDEPDARGLLKRILQDCRAEVLLAPSGGEGLTLLGTHSPHVVLCDIGMPGMDGYEFIRKLRASGDRTPAVAITAFARSEDRTRALVAGYDGYIAKPVEPAELVATIAAFARSYSRLRGDQTKGNQA